MRAFTNYNNLGTPIFNNNNNSNNSNNSIMIMNGVRYQRGCSLTVGVVKDEFAFMSEMEKKDS